MQTWDDIPSIIFWLNRASSHTFTGQANVDEHDDDDIHIEDSDGADDYSIDDEEEENSD
jgi:hypothetical protein